MSDENSENESIKVVDRRRFDESGSKSETDSSSTVQTSEKSTASSDSNAAPTGEKAKEAQASQEQAGVPSVDFPSFAMSLATQAMILMGEIPNPETNQMTNNMPAARQTIDILVLLEEKTKGNLSPEEERLMNEIVSSLQMAFVKKSGR